LRLATLKRVAVDVLAVGYGLIPQPEEEVRAVLEN
jgi:hypothetical protein